MRVIAFPADKAGCGWYRLRWPAAAVAAQGHNVELRDSVRAGDLLGNVDVVIVQRPLRMIVVDFIAWLQQQGVAVVVEIDDDVHHMPPGHPLHAEVAQTARTDGGLTRVALEQACQLADIVTVTTPALASLYAPHGRSVILPNCVPAARIGVPRPQPNPRPVVGYSGPTGFHKWDLDVVRNGIRQAQQRAGFDFVGIGGTDVHKRFRCEGTSHRWYDMHDHTPTGYAAAQARFDVGLVPLSMCLFNEGKSDLKGLEYASVGVPFIASPTSPYLALAEAGVGRIARTPAEWRERLLEQLDQPAPHAELIDYARTRTIEGNADRWWQAWQRAADEARSRSSRHDKAA